MGVEGGSCSRTYRSLAGVRVGVEGNADFLPTLILLGPYNQAHPAHQKRQTPDEAL